MNIRTINIHATEDGKTIADTTISYFPGQPFTIRLETPDGTDWKSDHITTNDPQPKTP